VEQKELQTALEGLKTELDKKSEERIKAIQDKAVEDAKKLTEEITSIKEAAEANQKALDQMIVERKNIKNEQGPKTAQQVMAETMQAKAADLKSLHDNKNFGGVSFDVKAAGTMLISNNYTVGTVGITSWDPEFVKVPLRQPFIRQIVSVRPVSSMYVAWAEQTARDGGVGMVAEGGAKPEVDFDWVEATKKVEKIAGYVKTSKEVLADIANAAAEINQELVDLIQVKLDDQILSGSGTTPNLKGILTYAPTISVAASVLALGVEQANNADVIRVAVWYIENAGLGKFRPNYVLLNPIDAAFMDVSKTSQGIYVMPPFSSTNGSTIAGLRVITSTAITAGTFLVGDFSKDVLGIREEINIQIGYENDDFTKNLVTIVGEMRAVNYIKANNVAAFVKGTFATVKAAMETA
jgi:HK97 family phage major capsid protein